MLRELDERKNSGLTVTLEWDTETGLVQVRCEDERSGDQPPLCYPVAPCDAWLAFLHPFAMCPLGVINSRIENRSDCAADSSSSGPTPDRARRWYHRLTNPLSGPDLIELGYTPWWGC
jgi:hypothetical protein